MGLVIEDLVRLVMLFVRPLPPRYPPLYIYNTKLRIRVMQNIIGTQLIEQTFAALQI